MTLEGARQRCAAVRAAYTESHAEGQRAETALWRDVIRSDGWEGSDPMRDVVATVERELEAATGRLSSLIEHVRYAA